jgi:putative ABC transport system permease protein
MFRHYLTTALRQARRHKLTTAINIVCLSIGLVCFVIAYGSVIYLKASERAFPNADRTYVISSNRLGENNTVVVAMPITPGLLGKYLKADVPELEAVARATGGPLAAPQGFPLTVGDKTVSGFATFVDPEFLSIFDLPFVQGDPHEALHSPDSAVLTERTADRLFGMRDVVGKRLLIRGRSVTVTGVIDAIPPPSHLADSVTSLMRSDVFVSMNVGDYFLQKEFGGFSSNVDRRAEDWNLVSHITYAMLPKDGSFTRAAFDQRLAGFGERRVPKDADRVRFTAAPVSGFLVSLTDMVLGSTGTMLLLLGGLVLAVACLNYDNLALAQGTTRAKEVGIRKILGAGRGQVIVQYLFESGLHTSMAVVLALGAIAFLLPILRSSAGIDLLPVLITSPTFWACLVALVTVVSVLAGAYPAFASSRLRPVNALQAGHVRIGLRFAPSLLVCIQFAVASFLLIAVIVMALQNRELRRVAFGGIGDQMVVITNSLRDTGTSMEALRAELLRSPHIRSVSATSFLPWRIAMSPTGVRRSPEAASASTGMGDNVVGPDFFATFDMTLIAGRFLDDQHADDLLPDGDDSGGARTYNAVVDRSAASKLGWSDPGAALGQKIYVPWWNVNRPPDQVQIVGVVENKPLALLGPAGLQANIYRLNPNAANFPLIRVSGNDIPQALAAIDAAWKRLEPGVPLNRRFGDELFEQSYRLFDAINKVFAGLAAFAFAISLMGLFGMALHVTNGRTREIGIRKTLGADVEQVVSLLLWDFSRPVAVANLIAWPLGFLAMQMYLRLFVQRMTLTVWPFLVSLVVTVLIAWVAVSIHTLRAARRKPAAVLRYE